MPVRMMTASHLKAIPGLLLVLLLALIFTLGACGRKGALYMPEPKPEETEQSQSNITTSSEEDSESKKKEQRQSETQ